jgi:D-alanyl-lipoteichoic acid acyltransferase DltB (MBOAT superfamily)
MLFNSSEFIFIFLPVSFFVYFYLLHKRLIIAAKGCLVFASLFFYSWWNVNYLPIILSSMLFNYLIGNSLNENFNKVRIHKRSLLIFGVIVNIALLCFFKYSDFLIENFNIAFNGSISLLNLTLPLAISFFTFQQIAYLVDSFRGETSEYDFLNYALFVTFFPQLIAGPIVHHAEMMPQFSSRWNLIKNYKNIATGLFIFSIGLFKKVVIADTFAQWATDGFDSAPVLNFFEAWGTSLSYTFQLYFDFSGYTDMAIGAALLFNIKLPINFNSPYKSLDIQDFWRRWHITLSRFLRDYVYIPLGGNRKGVFRIYTNILLTFIIGGFWHGAGWTFVFWGLLHGLALVIYSIWNKIGYTLPKVLAWFITFNFVNIAWVFFRAKDWEHALIVLKGMAGLSGIVIMESREQLLSFLSYFGFVSFGEVTQHIDGGSSVLNFILIGFLITLLLKNTMEITNIIPSSGRFILKFNFKWAFVFAVFIFVDFLNMFFGHTSSSEFLYFNF